MLLFLIYITVTSITPGPSNLFIMLSSKTFVSILAHPYNIKPYKTYFTWSIYRNLTVGALIASS